MKRFKILALVLALAMLVVTLVGCGSSARIAELETELEQVKAQRDEYKAQLDAILADPGAFFMNWYRYENIETRPVVDRTSGEVTGEQDVPYWQANLLFVNAASAKPSRELLEECIEFAFTQQTAVNFGQAYFVIFDTKEAIQALIDDPHGMPSAGTSPKVPMNRSIDGIAVVLVFCRVESVRPAYWHTYDTGAIAGVFNTAIVSRGYRIHWFCGYNWDQQTVYDPISWNGQAGTNPIEGHNWSQHMVQKYLFNKGFKYTSYAIGGFGSGQPTPVENANWEFMHGGIIGKPDWEANTNIASVVTTYNRPYGNYAIFTK